MTESSEPLGDELVELIAEPTASVQESADDSEPPGAGSDATPDAIPESSRDHQVCGFRHHRVRRRVGSQAFIPNHLQGG